MPNDPVVATRVKAALSDRGMTQRQLSERIGLDVTKLSKALSGRRRFTVDELGAISESLEVDFGWLTGEGDDRPPAVAPAGLTALAPDLYAGPDGEQRLAMVRAAWLLIAERGHGDVDLADVAARCEVDTATVSEHFPDRRALLDETLRLAAQQAYERQRDALVGLDDGLERLQCLIELQLPASEPLDREWSIWLQVWARAAIDPTIRALHDQAYRRWLETVRSAIERGQRQGSCRPGDAETMALRLTALIDGLGLQLVTRRGGADTTTVRAAVDDHLRAHVLAAGDHERQERS